MQNFYKKRKKYLEKRKNSRTFIVHGIASTISKRILYSGIIVCGLFYLKNFIKTKNSNTALLFCFGNRTQNADIFLIKRVS
jgi:hypothetical protein